MKVDKQSIQISKRLWVLPFYDKLARIWLAYYHDEEEVQLGHAWYGRSRDAVLVNRPAVPLHPARPAENLDEAFSLCFAEREAAEHEAALDRWAANQQVQWTDRRLPNDDTTQGEL